MRQQDKPNKSKIFSERMLILQGIFTFLIVGFILYLFCIQVLDVKEYRTKAKKQRRASAFVMRGNIYDRNGIKLATDTLYYDIFARKADFTHTEEELAKLLAQLLTRNAKTKTNNLIFGVQGFLCLALFLFREGF